jgi:hypothetical protein
MKNPYAAAMATNKIEVYMHAFDRHLRPCTNSIRFYGVLRSVVVDVFQSIFFQNYIKIIFLFKKLFLISTYQNNSKNIKKINFIQLCLERDAK